MSILDSIKSERKLSFNNWRYRLLHWCFNVKDPDPKRPQDTGLPKYLYTHYCPLFHLTNLIAILSPFILFVKVMGVICVAVATATASIPFDKMAALFLKLLPDLPKSKVKEVVRKKRSRNEETRMVVEFCCQWDKPEEFSTFMVVYKNNFETLEDADIEKIYKEYMPRIVEARERAKQRKAKLRESLIFWTNFSRVFIKWFLNIFYGAVVVGLLYGTYLVAGPLWNAVCYVCNGIYWAFTDAGSLSFLFLLLKVIFWLAISFGSIYLLARIGWIQKFGSVLWIGLSKLSPPFYLVGKFYNWVGSGFGAIREFISMFYEENCPPITLVTPEEEVVEAIAEETIKKE